MLNAAAKGSLNALDGTDRGSSGLNIRLYHKSQNEVSKNCGDTRKVKDVK